MYLLYYYRKHFKRNAIININPAETKTFHNFAERHVQFKKPHIRTDRPSARSVIIFSPTKEFDPKKQKLISTDQM